LWTASCDCVYTGYGNWEYTVNIQGVSGKIKVDLIDDQYLLLSFSHIAQRGGDPFGCNPASSEGYLNACGPCQTGVYDSETGTCLTPEEAEAQGLLPAGSIR
jgi:hypothetical protein